MFAANAASALVRKRRDLHRGVGAGGGTGSRDRRRTENHSIRRRLHHRKPARENPGTPGRGKHRFKQGNGITMAEASDWKKYGNILCVRPDNFGDVLMTTPAL